MGISPLSTLDYKVQLLDFALLNSKFQASNLMTLNQSLFVLFTRCDISRSSLGLTKHS